MQDCVPRCGLGGYRRRQSFAFQPGHDIQYYVKQIDRNVLGFDQMRNRFRKFAYSLVEILSGSRTFTTQIGDNDEVVMVDDQRCTMLDMLWYTDGPAAAAR